MDENVDLIDLLKSYLKHWKWFVFSVSIALSLSFLYLRYSTPLYVAEAKIKIIDDKNTNGGIDLFQELNVF